MQLITSDRFFPVMLFILSIFFYALTNFYWNIILQNLSHEFQRRDELKNQMRKSDLSFGVIGKINTALSQASASQKNLDMKNTRRGRSGTHTSLRSGFNSARKPVRPQN